jgi:two-component system, sporulation sensor kinase E
LLYEFKNGSYITLAIQDEGIGTSDSVLEKLGTPFLSTKERGTGLGLAVCYGIANRHQAKVDVETNGGGTTSYVRFPLIN